MSGTGGVLRGWRLAAFASPQAALALISFPLLTYIQPFYAGELGLDLVAVGAALSVARLWDLLCEPVIGLLTDRFPTRWGRRRPWILLSTPVLMACVFVLFTAPLPSSAVSLGAFLINEYTAWTFFSLSHVTWGGELSSDYDERTRIQGWLIFAFIGGILAASLIPIATLSGAAPATSRATLRSLAVVVIPLIPLTAMLALAAGREPAALARAPALGRRPAFAGLLGNGPLGRLMLTNLGEGLASGVTLTLIVFYVLAVLRLDLQAVPVLLLGNFAAAMVAVPGWMALAHRFGKHKALAGSALLNCLVGPLILLVPVGGLWGAAIVFMLLGANFGATPSLIRAIAADAVDIDMLTSGERRTGLFFALISMTNKLGYAIPPLLTSLVLDRTGFDVTRGAANNPTAILALTAMFVGLPALANLAVAALMWRFPIDQERQRAVRAELVARAGAL